MQCAHNARTLSTPNTPPKNLHIKCLFSKCRAPCINSVPHGSVGIFAPLHWSAKISVPKFSQCIRWVLVLAHSLRSLILIFCWHRSRRRRILHFSLSRWWWSAVAWCAALIAKSKSVANHSRGSILYKCSAGGYRTQHVMPPELQMHQASRIENWMEREKKK